MHVYRLADLRSLLTIHIHVLDMCKLWELTIGTEYISIWRISTTFDFCELNRCFDRLHYSYLSHCFDLILDVDMVKSRFQCYHLIQSSERHLRSNELLGKQV